MRSIRSVQGCPRSRSPAARDEERPDAHEAHGDQEGVLAADQIAEPAEDQRPEGTYRKARGKCEQREDEAHGRRDIREEVLCQEHTERAVDVKIVPFENGVSSRNYSRENLSNNFSSNMRLKRFKRFKTNGENDDERS